MTDSEFNLDPNCLSRCSTELFSEASWEQVDKQDTEVSLFSLDSQVETFCFSLKEYYYFDVLYKSIISVRETPYIL